jgi:hypothetical protein
MELPVGLAFQDIYDYQRRKGAGHFCRGASFTFPPAYALAPFEAVDCWQNDYSMGYNYEP